MLLPLVPSVLLSMVALITTYVKESDWLLKNFHQSENGLQSYHGEQNRGYHLKEHKKLYQKLVSKVMLHFVWGHLSRKQTVSPLSALHFLLPQKEVYVTTDILFWGCEWVAKRSVFSAKRQQKYFKYFKVGECRNLCVVHKDVYFFVFCAEIVCSNSLNLNI